MARTSKLDAKTQAVIASAVSKAELVKVKTPTKVQQKRGGFVAMLPVFAQRRENRQELFKQLTKGLKKAKIAYTQAIWDEAKAQAGIA